MFNNKFLAFIIFLSLLFTISANFLLINKIEQIKNLIIFNQPTAKVTETGKINLTIQNSISILLLNNTIDFGVGYINTSCEEIDPEKGGTKTFANLTAGETYIDTSDCWVSNATPTSFIIENNGNVNLSVSVKGPSALSFFNDYSGTSTYNLTIKARDSEPNSCVSGLNTVYAELHLNRTMCDILKYYPDNQDSIAIDVNLLIPVDLPQGTYENESIEFYAVQV